MKCNVLLPPVWDSLANMVITIVNLNDKEIGKWTKIKPRFFEKLEQIEKFDREKIEMIYKELESRLTT